MPIFFFTICIIELKLASFLKCDEKYRHFFHQGCRWRTTQAKNPKSFNVKGVTFFEVSLLFVYGCRLKGCLISCGKVIFFQNHPTLHVHCIGYQ